MGDTFIVTGGRENSAPSSALKTVAKDIDKICPEPSEINDTASGKSDVVEQYRILAKEKAEIEKNYRNLAREKAEIEEKYRKLEIEKANCGTVASRKDHLR